LTEPDVPASRTLTQRLISFEAARNGAPENTVAAAHAACERAYAELSRWLGSSGCHALFARAIIETREEHPVLRAVQLNERSDRALDGVQDGIDKAGAAAVARALEAMLSAVFDLLGRLIGPDMAARLLTQGVPDRADDDETPEPGSREP
jgi:hypothetical protein